MSQENTRTEIVKLATESDKVYPIKTPELHNGASTMPPKIGNKGSEDPFEGIRDFMAEKTSTAAFQRQESFLSFQALSIGDCNSVCDSQFSHYNPAINEPFVSEDASPDEVAMHAFLDTVGVFQVNIKHQLEEERKSLYSASPSLQKLSLGRFKRSSPSFMEKRTRMFSMRDSTTGSVGAHSQPNNTGAESTGKSGGRPCFGSDMFKPTQSTEESVTKSCDKIPGGLAGRSRLSSNNLK